MNPTDASGIHAEFRIQDPIQVFDAFSQEEIERRRQTDPHFDEPLHQDARTLILNRLRALRFGKENHA
ncbi:MAG: hypothetical protein H7839_07665 [Magnetococcus sp. YQC-5]